MEPWLGLVGPFLVLAAVVSGDGPRLRRQAHHLGAPQQFGLAPGRAPTPPAAHQLLLPRPGPQLAFQFLPHRPEAHTASPAPLQPTPGPALQPAAPRTRAPVQHSSFLPTPRPALQSSVRRPSGGQQQSGGGARGRLSVTREELADELPEGEDLEELDKPDRLTELLPLSKFDCAGRGTGYYADEGLQCEVFHYCQAGAKHSWICPEGFTFHQVHLICMPPGGDNICKKSSQFHFVNEYLYRPINAEEAQTKPNVTLRYADRYYPENYERDEDEEQQPLVFATPHRLSVAGPQPKRPQLAVRLAPLQQRSNQVFHSPEEVNIPLQHRRPVVVQHRSQDKYDEEEYDDRPTYRQG